VAVADAQSCQAGVFTADFFIPFAYVGIYGPSFEFHKLEMQISLHCKYLYILTKPLKIKD